MKTLTTYLVAILALLSNTANAGSDLCIYRFPENYCGPITQISCSYKSRTGQSQKIIYELPANMDFRHISGPTVNLYVKGTTESILFNVTTQVEDRITKTQLNYRHPFFVSDIHLSFDKETRSNTIFNPVAGSLTTDYPPVIKMDCGFD